MSDIVERLREMENDMVGPYRQLTLDAANMIEVLRVKVEVLRAKLATQLSDWHDAEVERLRNALDIACKDQKP